MKLPVIRTLLPPSFHSKRIGNLFSGIDVLVVALSVEHESLFALEFDSQGRRYLGYQAIPGPPQAPRVNAPFSPSPQQAQTSLDRT